MNGAIIPHTPIAVDFWNARETSAKNCRLFFLTHAHADHTVGLTSSWKNHKIYCSELTKKLVVHKNGVSEELVVGLPVDQPVVIAMDDVGKENLTVTLIDANHCPGAVLFLFQGYFGNILYTGDFRYYSSLSTHQALQHTVIDKLYLDNTYCDPKCAFPTREKATSMILDVVRNHLDFNIVFGMNTLGKEEMLAKIGIEFKTWIGVEPKRMETLKLLDVPDVFTCDTNSTSIRVVMKKEISKKNLHMWNEEHPTIAILPTALFEGDCNLYKNMKDVYVIPFSDHSSFEELVTFVSEIKPKEIIPLVLRHRGPKGDPDNIRSNMTVFNTFLNKEPLRAFTIPETVLQFMGARTTVGKTKKRTKSFTAPKQKRAKCTGVVFSDEEDTSVEITMQDRCLGEMKVPENAQHWNQETSCSVEQVHQHSFTEKTTEEIKVKEEPTLQNSCVMEDVSRGVANEKSCDNLEQSGEDIKVEKDLHLQNSFALEDVNTRNNARNWSNKTCTCNTLEQVNKDADLGSTSACILTQKDIKVEKDLNLQNFFVIEQANVCKNGENWNEVPINLEQVNNQALSSGNVVIKREDDVKIKEEPKDPLFDQRENIYEGIFNEMPITLEQVDNQASCSENIIMKREEEMEIENEPRKSTSEVRENQCKEIRNNEILLTLEQVDNQASCSENIIMKREEEMEIENEPRKSTSEVRENQCKEIRNNEILLTLEQVNNQASCSENIMKQEDEIKIENEPRKSTSELRENEYKEIRNNEILLTLEQVDNQASCSENIIMKQEDEIKIENEPRESTSELRENECKEIRNEILLTLEEVDNQASSSENIIMKQEEEMEIENEPRKSTSEVRENQCKEIRNNEILLTLEQVDNQASCSENIIIKRKEEMKIENEPRKSTSELRENGCKEIRNNEVLLALEQVENQASCSENIIIKQEEEMEIENEPRKSTSEVRENECKEIRNNEILLMLEQVNNQAPCSENKVIQMEEDMNMEYEPTDSLGEQKEKDCESIMNGENEKMGALPEQEVRNIPSTCTNKSAGLKPTENGITVGGSPGSDKQFALSLLQAFDHGEHEDGYTKSNPVYKRFVSHFCEYVKALTSDETQEAEINNENEQCPLHCSVRLNDNPKSGTQGSHRSTRSKNVSWVELDDDSDDSDESEFNWFSSI